MSNALRSALSRIEQGLAATLSTTSEIAQGLATDLVWLLWLALALTASAWVSRVQLAPVLARHYLEVELALSGLDVDVVVWAESPLSRLLVGDVPFDKIQLAITDLVVSMPAPAAAAAGPSTNPAPSPHSLPDAELLRAQRARVWLKRVGPLAFDVEVELSGPIIRFVAYDLELERTNLGWLWARAGFQNDSKDDSEAAHLARAPAAQPPRTRAGGFATHTEQPSTSTAQPPPTRISRVRLLDGELCFEANLKDTSEVCRRWKIHRVEDQPRRKHATPTP
ncbi:hypothetical protein T492DRAFT_336783 [Pavlovales sp. CCMP2436]|nr:hypothetical protein T492DRAFT_336783 [Pavlovales sp. CCMP2436]